MYEYTKKGYLLASIGMIVFFGSAASATHLGIVWTLVGMTIGGLIMILGTFNIRTTKKNQNDS